MRTGIEQGLVKHILTSEEETMLIMGADSEELVEFFQKFKIGEYYDIRGANFILTNRHVIQEMEDYITSLKKSGLDIDRGSAEFGYKMPLPEKKDYYRDLRIFRRR